MLFAKPEHFDSGRANTLSCCANACLVVDTAASIPRIRIAATATGATIDTMICFRTIRTDGWTKPYLLT
jgi:hypothetical protein